MKKITFLIAFCLISTVVLAQGKAINPVTKSLQGETATYKVISKSEFGSDKNTLILKMNKVGYSSLEVKKTMKWKGREHSRVTDYRVNDTLKKLVSSLKENLNKRTKGWVSPTVSLRGGVEESSVSLPSSAQIITEKRDKNTNQVLSTSKSTRSSFNCYKLTFEVSGEYQKKQVKMVATYWVAKPTGENRVPVFGLVKSEITVEQTIKKIKFTGKITMVLSGYTKVKH